MTEIADQLHPCPLCGGIASYVEEIKTIHIKCDSCGLKTPPKSSFDPKFELEQTRCWARHSLKDAWNQRQEEKTVKTKFLVQVRRIYAEEHKHMSDRGWANNHTCAYPPNPQWPQEYIAKKLGRDYLKGINAEPEVFEFDEDGEPDYYPTPVLIEYRIVRETRTEEVIEYGSTKTMGPTFQKDPDLDDARLNDKKREAKFAKLLADAEFP